MEIVKAASAVAVYVAAVVAANVLTFHFGLVPVGFGMLVTAGTYAAGFALLARDFVHRYAGVGWALIGVALGVALSWALASPAIAAASAIAFLVAELVDLALYAAVRPRGFVRAAVLSNVASAPLDTVLFLLIAGFPLTLESVAGQFVGKVLWATLVPLLLWVGVTRAVLRYRLERRDEASYVGR